MKHRFLYLGHQSIGIGLTAVLIHLAIQAGSKADTTINESDKFSYSANAGWLNWRHQQPTESDGVVFGHYFLSGYAYAANFGWVFFGNGKPANGIRYGNISDSDSGVNHDGGGNLSGYAYAANVGWINFQWNLSPTDPNRPRVNLTTGAFEGYAYGANIGWISLGNGSLITDAMSILDQDEDEIADPWELEHFGNLKSASPTSNADGDGLSDYGEYLADTDPHLPQSYLDIISYLILGDGSKVTIEFTTTSHRRYRLQWSNQLGIGVDKWVESGFGLIIPDPGATTTRTVSSPLATRRFIRVVPTLPLQP